MARKSGKPDQYCEVTGKRKFRSKKHARRGLKHSSDRLGVYVCPHCHCHHLRNQERYSKGKLHRYKQVERPMGKKNKKGKRKKRRKNKRSRRCDFCFDPKSYGRYMERNICRGCIQLLKKGQWGRHKLISALEEAARIRAQEEREGALMQRERRTDER